MRSLKGWKHLVSLYICFLTVSGKLAMVSRKPTRPWMFSRGMKGMLFFNLPPDLINRSSNSIWPFHELTDTEKATTKVRVLSCVTRGRINAVPTERRFFQGSL